MESESSAGDDGIENIRALDQLLGATRVVFKDKSAMMKFLFGEFRRWGGRQLLNHVYFERTGRVKWMPEASDAVPVPVRHTFFHTAISSSRPLVQLAEPDGETDATPDPDAVPQPELPSPAATRVFNLGLETTVEFIMRLSTTGPAPVENDIDDAGLVGGIGSQRRPKPNEMSMIAPLPPRDLQHRRGCIIPHSWTIVNEPTQPHTHASHYGGVPLTMQDLDIGQIIWRCMLCEYQWYTVEGLEMRDDNTICPHCGIPITKLDRPPWYTEPVKHFAKAPPVSVLNQ